MPIESTIDHQSRIVRSSATGHITLDDVRTYFGEMWTGPEYVGYSEIMDWTGSERVGPSVGQRHSLAGAARAWLETAG